MAGTELVTLGDVDDGIGSGGGDLKLRGVSDSGNVPAVSSANKSVSPKLGERGSVISMAVARKRATGTVPEGASSGNGEPKVATTVGFSRSKLLATLLLGSPLLLTEVIVLARARDEVENAVVEVVAASSALHTSMSTSSVQPPLLGRATNHTAVNNAGCTTSPAA